MEETVRQVIDDLTSRGALSGAASLLLLAGTIAIWWLWTSLAKRNRREAEPVILVAGSRGKSSTIRLIHAALSEAGLRPYGKITGTEASELATDGTEQPTFRLGAPSVTETLGTLRRAHKGSPPADALVFECMAVSPELIALLSDRIVDPDTVVITNVRLDHLEEEGSSPAEIARSLSEAIRPDSLILTGESEPDPLAVIEQRAAELDARLVACDSDAVPAEILGRLPGAHPQNVALTLALTRSLGIADGVAVDGMSGATHEPGEQEIWRRRLNGLEATWFDLGAINDPESLSEALDGFGDRELPTAPRIAFVFGRWDRPLRALEFAGFLQPGDFDGLVLAGGPVHQMRRALTEGGWDPRSVVIASQADYLRPVWTHEVRDLVRAIDPAAGEVVLVSLQNEHDGLANRVRGFFRDGNRLDGALTTGGGDRNVA